MIKDIKDMTKEEREIYMLASRPGMTLRALSRALAYLPIDQNDKSAQNADIEAINVT